MTTLSRRIVVFGSGLASLAALAAAPARSEDKLFRIYFHPNDATMPDVGVEVADAVAAYIEAPEVHAAEVEITGHADTSEAKPRTLSLHRAQEVRRRLLAKGVPASMKMTVRGAGATGLPVPIDPGTSEPLDRVVEIVVK